MSASLVKQSLELVDSDFKSKGPRKKLGKEIFGLFSEQHRILSKTQRKGSKAEKVGLSIVKKYTVIEAKRKVKSKKEILKENLKKLELIRKNCQIVLDKESTKNIIERAVTKRPIKTEKKELKGTNTAFTEEDFKKFEEEYLNS